MKSREYWAHRFELLEEAQHEKAAEYYRELEEQYRAAADEVEKQLSRWYTRFATENNISITEARRLLNTRELAEFRWDVKEYIKHGEQLGLDNTWMKQLENASIRVHVSRLEALKVQIQQQAERCWGGVGDDIDELARKIYTDGYYHTAFEIQRGVGVGWDVMKLDQRRIDKVISKPWTPDGSNFSSRVWNNRRKLVSELHTQLTQNMILGSSPKKSIDVIAKRFNVSKGRASNLVMTESAFFASAAQRDCFNDLDVERYEVVATLDSHTSQTCRDMDGHVFDMKDYEVGATAPPFHGRCRSVTAPWFDDNYIEERAARGADGKTYYVPGNMKYEDWYEVFVEQSSDMADWKAAHLISTVAESTFTPAKTIPEADKFARDQGVENVSFKGIDIDIANSANQSLYEHFTEFPELKENIHFWGSAQEKKKFLGDAVKEYYENAYAKYRGAYPDAYLDKRIKSKATSYFRTSGEWAHAFDHRKHFENEMFSGIAVNSNQVKNVSRFMELLKRDVGSRFHPVGCDTVKSIFDHEFGHQLDYLLGISKNPKFVKWMTYGIESGEKIITNNLSKYAMKNRKEVIAEAWAEYRNNPEPRPVAKAIGELIESEYKRKFGK